MGSCTDPIGSTLEKRLIDSIDMCDLMGITTPAGLMREAAAEIERLQSAASEVILAFEALGTERGATAEVRARQRCEKSMVALKTAVFRPNVGIEPTSRRTGDSK